ncbi:MAG TPA: carbamoyltransferase C-terminal domain-containing protein [Methanomicrobiales archaeon]|nr:carbamoyltransferase C-terminal domain-containing protein [Methanomicrobiales archaeon]
MLNTSFNLHGEPMVFHPADALHTWLSSGVDSLIMESFVITR